VSVVEFFVIVVCFISSLLNTFSEPPPLYAKITNGTFSLPFFIDIVISLFVYWDKFVVAMVNDRRRIAINAAIIINLPIFLIQLIVPFEVGSVLQTPQME
jgi:hypothetical protein